MSFCRWSSDDFRCDLYVYEDCGGYYVTWVAGNRCVGDIPRVPGILDTPREEWSAAYERQHAFLESCERKPIGLPHDGARFQDDTPEELKATLVMLREAGYRFPDYVLDAVEGEIAAGYRPASEPGGEPAGG